MKAKKRKPAKPKATECEFVYNEKYFGVSSPAGCFWFHKKDALKVIKSLIWAAFFSEARERK